MDHRAEKHPASQLYLYGTDHCHLCDQARRMLLEVDNAGQFTVQTVDIAEDDALSARYGERIPVLAASGTDVELDWPFDHEDIGAFLREARNKTV